MKTLALLFSASPLLLVLASCNDSAAGPLEAPLGLKNEPLLGIADNPVTAEKAELGKVLFFDPRLSGSGKMACVTCHPPEKGWADGEKFSKKDDGTMNTRNTPTVVNTGYLPHLYWDGRAEGLEDNVLKAWKAQMSGDPAAVAGKLNAVKAYEDMFQKAFKSPANEKTIVQALSTFLRTLRSGNSPFDRWQYGKDNAAVNNDVKEGWGIFNTAGCNACHLPPKFTDGTFHSNGVGFNDQPVDQGRGKLQADLPLMMGAFKTPTLREASRTGPYFHNGSVASLEEAVKIMAQGGVKGAPNIDPQLKDAKLTDDQIKKLVALIQSLQTDTVFKKPTVP